MGNVGITTEPVAEHAGVLERLNRAEHTGVVRLAHILVRSNANASDVTRDSFTHSEANSDRPGHLTTGGHSMFHHNQPATTNSRRLGTGLIAGAVFALAVGFSTGPAEAAGGGKPLQVRDEYVETYENPHLAAACGIETVQIVEHGSIRVTLFPDGTTVGTFTEEGVWSNPATGDEVTTRSHNQQAGSAEVTQDGDTLTIVQQVSFSGLSDWVKVPGHGVVSIQAGHFEAILTTQLDVSTDPPTLIGFDEEVLATAGTVRDSVSTEALATICEGLGGSLVPD